MLIADDNVIDIFVGSRIGSFKHIKYHTDSSKNSKKCIENLVEIKSLQKDDAITCMEWGNVEQTEILLGRRNQQIQIYDTLQGFTKTHTADFGTGDVVGLGRCKRKLLAAVSSGVVKIWSKKEEVTVDTGGKLDRMRVYSEDRTLFGTGGEENDLKIWRIGETSPLFAAKNLAHDWLQLRRPVWVADLAFLPGEGGRVVAVCSRHGYVRLYDSRAQRRPVCNVEFPSMAATCLTPSFEGRQVLVGFGRGQQHQVDLRKARPDKGYKGCAGAVTSLALGSGGLVVSASLDRQLRVHQHSSKELVYKQYLTSKLSCVLVQNENSTPLRNPKEVDIKEEEEFEEVEQNDDLDQLFEHMETVGDKPKKKKLPIEKVAAKKFKPSIEGSTTEDSHIEVEESIGEEPAEAEANEEDAIVKLLRSTEKQKRRIEKRKKEKKAKSVFHNA